MPLEFTEHLFEKGIKINWNARWYHIQEYLVAAGFFLQKNSTTYKQGECNNMRTFMDYVSVSISVVKPERKSFWITEIELIYYK